LFLVSWGGLCEGAVGNACVSMESVEITDSIDNENSDTNFPRADDNMERLSKEGGTVVASNNNNYYYNNTGGGDEEETKIDDNNHHPPPRHPLPANNLLINNNNDGTLRLYRDRRRSHRADSDDEIIQACTVNTAVDSPETVNDNDRLDSDGIDWSIARRDSLIAENTYTETMKAIEKSRAEFDMRYKALTDSVTLKDKRFVELHEECVRMTGKICSEVTDRARVELEEEEGRLSKFKVEYDHFVREAEKLELELLKVKDQKERLYQLSLMSGNERKLAKLKEQAQSLRYAAHKLDLEIASLQDKALSMTDDDAQLKYDDILEKTRIAEHAWIGTLAAFKFGLEQVSVHHRDWWLRAMDSVKNSYLIKVIENHWFEARKCECSARIAEKELNQKYGYTQVPANEDWKQAIAVATTTNTVYLWHHVAHLIRNYLDDLHEIFHGWWLRQLKQCVEYEANWTDFCALLEDRAVVATPNLSPEKLAVATVTHTRSNTVSSSGSKSHDKTSSGACKTPDSNNPSRSAELDESFDEAEFGEISDVLNMLAASGNLGKSTKPRRSSSQDENDGGGGVDDMVSVRSSLNAGRKSHLLSCDTVNLDELEEEIQRSKLISSHKRRFTFGSYFRTISTPRSKSSSSVANRSHSPSTRDIELQVEEIADDEEEERKHIRFAHNSIISAEMIARQEETIELCFREANLARARLLYHYQRPSFHLPGVMGTKIAHTMYLNKTAMKKYATLVKAQACEDAKKDSLESNRLFQSWKNRIEVDQLVAANSKDVSDQAEREAMEYVYKVKFHRNYIRTIAILDADIAAVHAAWPGK
jgi:hypothetical protein